MTYLYPDVTELCNFYSSVNDKAKINDELIEKSISSDSEADEYYLRYVMRYLSKTDIDRAVIIAAKIIHSENSGYYKKKMAMQYHKGIHVYQILRHIMNMDNVSLIHILFNKGYLNVNEAAFINIVEEKYEEAFEYLKESELDNEALLDYFCASAPRLYHQLMRRNKTNALYRLSFA